MEFHIMKQCSKCNLLLDLSLFYKQSSGKFGVASRCKTCLLQSNKEWSLKNKEKHKELIKRWGNTHKEKRLQSNRDWRKCNLKYDAYRSKLYRARKNNQCPIWADLEKIKEIYLNCPEGHHVDHIIPLKGIKASGLHIETNLQYLTAKENMSKRNLFGWDCNV